MKQINEFINNKILIDNPQTMTQKTIKWVFIRTVWAVVLLAFLGVMYGMGGGLAQIGNALNK